MLGKGPVTPRVPEKGALSQNNRGPGPPAGYRTPIYYPDPSAGREQTPRLGGSGAATYPQAQALVRLRDFLGKTRPPTAFNAGGEVRSATAEPEVTFARLYC